MINDLVIGMAGSGGDGVVSAGESMMTALALEGYYAMLTKSFGPQIRGGESSFRLRLSTRPVLNPGGTLDVAVALNWEDFLKFGGELPVGGRTVVIYDSNTGVRARQAAARRRSGRAECDPGRRSRPWPRTRSGTEKAKNTVVLGLVAGWFGIGRASACWPASRSGSRRRARRSWSATSARSRRASSTPRRTRSAPGCGHGSGAWQRGRSWSPTATTCAPPGAIFAGCQFFGGYPITPSSEIMQFLNREIWKYGGVDAAVRGRDRRHRGAASAPRSPARRC